MPAPVTLPTPDEVNAMIQQSFSGIGTTCVEIGADYALARRTCTETELRPGGFISGPTQFGIVDAVLWYATFGAIGRIEPMAMTSELSIRYLRPCIGTELWARATIHVAGRRNVVGTVNVWTDNPDKPTAVAQGTYALPNP